MLEADVFGITPLALNGAFRFSSLPVKIVLFLHDGIWFICPDDRATSARVGEKIQEIMENSVRLSVPLKTKLCQPELCGSPVILNLLPPMRLCGIPRVPPRGLRGGVSPDLTEAKPPSR
jgi:hypothetical protein